VSSAGPIYPDIYNELRGPVSDTRCSGQAGTPSQLPHSGQSIPRIIGVDSLYLFFSVARAELKCSPRDVRTTARVLRLLISESDSWGPITARFREEIRHFAGAAKE
jgi:hypothetical protein